MSLSRPSGVSRVQRAAGLVGQLAVSQSQAGSKTANAIREALFTNVLSLKPHEVRKRLKAADEAMDADGVKTPEAEQALKREGHLLTKIVFKESLSDADFFEADEYKITQQNLKVLSIALNKALEGSGAAPAHLHHETLREYKVLVDKYIGLQPEPVVAHSPPSSPPATPRSTGPGPLSFGAPGDAIDDDDIIAVRAPREGAVFGPGASRSAGDQSVLSAQLARAAQAQAAAQQPVVPPAPTSRPQPRPLGGGMSVLRSLSRGSSESSLEDEPINVIAENRNIKIELVSIGRGSRLQIQIKDGLKAKILDGEVTRETLDEKASAIRDLGITEEQYNRLVPEPELDEEGQPIYSFGEDLFTCLQNQIIEEAEQSEEFQEFINSVDTSRVPQDIDAQILAKLNLDDAQFERLFGDDIIPYDLFFETEDEEGSEMGSSSLGSRTGGPTFGSGPGGARAGLGFPHMQSGHFALPLRHNVDDADTDSSQAFRRRTRSLDGGVSGPLPMLNFGPRDEVRATGEHRVRPTGRRRSDVSVSFADSDIRSRHSADDIGVTPVQPRPGRFLRRHSAGDLGPDVTQVQSDTTVPRGRARSFDAGTSVPNETDSRPMLPLRSRDVDGDTPEHHVPSGSHTSSEPSTSSEDSSPTRQSSARPMSCWQRLTSCFVKSRNPSEQYAVGPRSTTGSDTLVLAADNSSEEDAPRPQRSGVGSCFRFFSCCRKPMRISTFVPPMQGGSLRPSSEHSSDGSTHTDTGGVRRSLVRFTEDGGFHPQGSAGDLIKTGVLDELGKPAEGKTARVAGYFQVTEPELTEFLNFNEDRPVGPDTFIKFVVMKAMIIDHSRDFEQWYRSTTDSDYKRAVLRPLLVRGAQGEDAGSGNRNARKLLNSGGQDDKLTAKVIKELVKKVLNIRDQSASPSGGTSSALSRADDPTGGPLDDSMLPDPPTGLPVVQDVDGHYTLYPIRFDEGSFGKANAVLNENRPITKEDFTNVFGFSQDSVDDVLTQQVGLSNLNNGFRLLLLKILVLKRNAEDIDSTDRRETFSDHLGGSNVSRAVIDEDLSSQLPDSVEGTFLNKCFEGLDFETTVEAMRGWLSIGDEDDREYSTDSDTSQTSIVAPGSRRLAAVINSDGTRPLPSPVGGSRRDSSSTTSTERSPSPSPLPSPNQDRERPLSPRHSPPTSPTSTPRTRTDSSDAAGSTVPTPSPRVEALVTFEDGGFKVTTALIDKILAGELTPVTVKAEPAEQLGVAQTQLDAFIAADTDTNTVNQFVDKVFDAALKAVLEGSKGSLVAFLRGKNHGDIREEGLADNIVSQRGSLTVVEMHRLFLKEEDDTTETLIIKIKTVLNIRPDGQRPAPPKVTLKPVSGEIELVRGSLHRFFCQNDLFKKSELSRLDEAGLARNLGIAASDLSSFITSMPAPKTIPNFVENLYKAVQESLFAERLEGHLRSLRDSETATKPELVRALFGGDDAAEARYDRVFEDETEAEVLQKIKAYVLSHLRHSPPPPLVESDGSVLTVEYAVVRNFFGKEDFSKTSLKQLDRADLAVKLKVAEPALNEMIGDGTQDAFVDNLFKCAQQAVFKIRETAVMHLARQESVTKDELQRRFFGTDSDAPALYTNIFGDETEVAIHEKLKAFVLAHRPPQDSPAPLGGRTAFPPVASRRSKASATGVDTGDDGASGSSRRGLVYFDARGSFKVHGKLGDQIASGEVTLDKTDKDVLAGQLELSPADLDDILSQLAAKNPDGDFTQQNLVDRINRIVGRSRSSDAAGESKGETGSGSPVFGHVRGSFDSVESEGSGEEDVLGQGAPNVGSSAEELDAQAKSLLENLEFMNYAIHERQVNIDGDGLYNFAVLVLTLGGLDAYKEKLKAMEDLQRSGSSKRGSGASSFSGDSGAETKVSLGVSLKKTLRFIDGRLRGVVHDMKECARALSSAVLSQEQQVGVRSNIAALEDSQTKYIKAKEILENPDRLSDFIPEELPMWVPGTTVQLHKGIPNEGNSCSTAAGFHFLINFLQTRDVADPDHMSAFLKVDGEDAFVKTMTLADQGDMTDEAYAAHKKQVELQNMKALLHKAYVAMIYCAHDETKDLKDMAALEMVFDLLLMDYVGKIHDSDEWVRLGFPEADDFSPGKPTTFESYLKVLLSVLQLDKKPFAKLLDIKRFGEADRVSGNLVRTVRAEREEKISVGDVGESVSINKPHKTLSESVVQGLALSWELQEGEPPKYAFFQVQRAKFGLKDSYFDTFVVDVVNEDGDVVGRRRYKPLKSAVQYYGDKGVMHYVTKSDVEKTLPGGVKESGRVLFDDAAVVADDRRQQAQLGNLDPENADELSDKFSLNYHPQGCVYEIETLGLDEDISGETHLEFNKDDATLAKAVVQASLAAATAEDRQLPSELDDIQSYKIVKRSEETARMYSEDDDLGDVVGPGLFSSRSDIIRPHLKSSSSALGLSTAEMVVVIPKLDRSEDATRLDESMLRGRFPEYVVSSAQKGALAPGKLDVIKVEGTERRPASADSPEFVDVAEGDRSPTKSILTFNFGGTSSGYEKNIKDMYAKILDSAKSYGVTSVELPLLGVAGAGGPENPGDALDPVKAALIAQTEVLKWMDRKIGVYTGESPIKVVINVGDHQAAYEEAMDLLYPDDEVVEA